MKKHTFPLLVLLLLWGQTCLGQAQVPIIESFPLPSFDWSETLSLSEDEWKTQSLEDLKIAVQIISNKLDKIQSDELRRFFKNVANWTQEVKKCLNDFGRKCNKGRLYKLKHYVEELKIFLEGLDLILTEKVYLKLKDLDIHSLNLKIRLINDIEAQFGDPLLRTIEQTTNCMIEKNNVTADVNDYTRLRNETFRNANNVYHPIMTRKGELIKILLNFIELRI